MTDRSDDTDGLFLKLQALADSDELSPAQKELLAAILRVAGDITDALGRQDDRVFADEFEEAYRPYTPHTVAKILAYAEAPPPPAMVVRSMIVRGETHADLSTPAMIVRHTHPGTAGHTHTDDHTG